MIDYSLLRRKPWAYRLIVTALVLLFLLGGSGAPGAYAAGNREATGSGGSNALAQKAATYKWIDIDLSSQTLRAYEGRKVVYTTKISSGVRKYPTVTGTFRVYVKLRYARMRGGRGAEAYDLANVPHVMYFYKGYGIHGAYWHKNFGRPMSHGCVNANLTAAAWLYNWARVGTQVTVHQ
jgi:lipoprotein-anchoring transpeptidase ErfK/SrfK